ncbi:MAG TPA: aminoglycoside adenylyltransferase domain-containing protein [Actinomycetota bacterium]|jgi:hypothetical protein|nr:aminoglycoside adenylyltransferase domain-containing protein [Actinomycetota bacterium]
MFLDGHTSTYVRTVTERLRSLFGEDLLGVYLVGSGSMGGFDPQKSDVDLAAVVSGSLSLEHKREAVRRLSHAALSCPVRKLELVVYGAQAVEGPSPSLRWELNLNTGAAVGVEASFDPGAEPGHWFVLDVAMAREQARALFGPPPQDVLGEIERGRVLRALLASLRWHRENDWEGVQSVLNACRAWRWLEEKTWSPKPVAAAWAHGRVDDPGLIDDALARGTDGSSALDKDAVLRLVKNVERRIEQSLGES